MTLSHEQVVQAVDESDWTLLIDCLHIIAVEDWWGRFLATGEVQFLANDTGVIFWRDLTVPNAEQVRDFYSQVVGWRAEPLEMGDYADFIMTAPGADQPTAGLCHARGVNADLPAQWLIYIKVADLDQALAQCQALGGHIVAGPRQMGRPNASSSSKIQPARWLG